MSPSAFLVIFVWCLSALCGQSGDSGQSGRGGRSGSGSNKKDCSPPKDDYPSETIEVELEGASCFAGDPYYYYIRPGNPEFVTFVISGGGFCFDFDSCNQGELVEVVIDRDFFTQSFGFVDGKPLKDDTLQWTVVILPQCTEDLQIGANQFCDESGLFCANFGGANNIRILLNQIGSGDEQYEINKHVNFDDIKHLALWGFSSGCIGAAAWGFTFFDMVSDDTVKTLILDGWTYGEDLQLTVFPFIGAVYNIPASPVLAGMPQDIAIQTATGQATLRLFVESLQKKYCELFVSTLLYEYDSDQTVRYFGLGQLVNNLEWQSFLDPVTWEQHMLNRVIPELETYAPKRSSYYVAAGSDHVYLAKNEADAAQIKTDCDEDQTAREYLYDVFMGKRSVWWFYGKPEKRVKSFPKFSYNNIESNCVSCNDDASF